MCPENELYEKNIVTIEEILTRRANLIILTDTKKTKEFFKNHSNVKIILINESNDFLSSPFLFIVSVQLLAYYTAQELGRNIDKPRNLAKSVTVE
jgi:glucosamine--fructose-6-phosphate aminotransferase (isomerizing)